VQIIAVMREAGTDRHGARLRALIVVCGTLAFAGQSGNVGNLKMSGP
jgi:hypothetical protein